LSCHQSTTRTPTQEKLIIHGTNRLGKTLDTVMDLKENPVTHQKTSVVGRKNSHGHHNIIMNL
jgi:hypothetical protein